MRVIALRDLEQRIDARKAELGIVGDDYVAVNSGAARTASKKALLLTLRRLAEEQGRDLPFQANI